MAPETCQRIEFKRLAAVLNGEIRALNGETVEMVFQLYNCQSGDANT